jgi:TRAP-type mannitol/chloroaromatic compound transport system permease small subunit
MKAIIDKIETVNMALGLAASWCTLAMLLFQMISVLLRYVFSYGLITFQEAVIYCHAVLFMLGAAYVLQLNEHVRVDVIYASLGKTARRRIDIIALLFFVVPVAVVIGWFGLPYVARSWTTLEGSRQSGGIPAIFLLKTTIVVFAVSVGLQAICTAARLIGNGADSKWAATDLDDNDSRG